MADRHQLSALRSCCSTAGPILRRGKKGGAGNQTNKKTKTRREAGSEKTCVTRDSYPAGCGIVGRRAREVMPAAMRALVRIETLAGRWNIRRECEWLSGRLNDDTEVLRNATTAAAARAVEA
jgi:hypothetical protein